MGDAINPEHYKTGSIEVIDFIREQLTHEEFRGFCKGNAIKYMARGGKKDAQRHEQDMAKAGWYGQMGAHASDPDKYPDPRTLLPTPTGAHDE